MATKKNAKASPRNGKAPKSQASRKAEASTAEKKKMSALDAAARVLAENKEPMSCAQMIEAMAAKGYWKSPSGQTPDATLSSAIQREISLKKGESRFTKTAPGRFAVRQSR